MGLGAVVGPCRPDEPWDAQIRAGSRSAHTQAVTLVAISAEVTPFNARWQTFLMVAMEGGRSSRPATFRGQFADDLTPGLEVSPTRHGDCGTRSIIVFRDTR